MNPTPKKPQIDKFREAARELETDDSDESFDRLVKEIARPQKPENSRKERKDS